MNSPIASRVKVRPGRLADAPDIVRLCEQLGYRTPLAQARKVLSSKKSTVLVADLDGFVAGFAEVRKDEPSLISDPSRAELVGLVVDEGFRSGGVGAALVAAAEAWAKGRRLASMRLRCNVKREAAHRFYERHGYAHAKTSKVYDKRLS